MTAHPGYASIAPIVKVVVYGGTSASVYRFGIVGVVVVGGESPRDEDGGEHHVPQPQRLRDHGIVVPDDYLQQPRLP
jgi:hypothetical protein